MTGFDPFLYSGSVVSSATKASRVDARFFVRLNAGASRLGDGWVRRRNPRGGSGGVRTPSLPPPQGPDVRLSKKKNRPLGVEATQQQGL